MKSLSKLDDPELMTLSKAAWTRSYAVALAGRGVCDSIILEAIYATVNDKEFSSAWAWNRLRNPQRWESWKRHKQELAEMGIEFQQQFIAKHDKDRMNPS